MRSLLLASLAAAFSAIAALPHQPEVRGEALGDCPGLSAKPLAKKAEDLRPDEISVVMAIGDSITAGLFARPASDDLSPSMKSREADQHFFPGFKGFEEYRGVSFSTGGDADAVTLANNIRYYNPDLKGQSYGHHRPPVLSKAFGHTPANDGLNAAKSGAKAKDLLSQVEDYILPSLNEVGVETGEWKLMTLSIGANDVCDYCLAGNSTVGGPGSPEEFADNVKKAIVAARDNIREVHVVVVGLFQVSSIYNLSRQQPPCTPLRLPPIFPTLPIECQCAWAPGPLGDASRKKMDALGEEYNQALQVVVAELNAENRGDFMVIWQPGTFLSLADFPTIALSPIDCFHPSREAHRRIGAGLWNRLTLPQNEKALPMTWDEVDHVRCLRDDDRIRN
ncbi:hypothetical protein FFLO_03446 [Filobasidium floriforme]|uniref:Uncharacterized protein n=1 Tax=Filobasidium floriforme TaxID=5210 RepID=A0A8K0NT53_9TREE|nr:hypothetical protein FFLO_03446 [Filobasidium floriforme]